MFGFLEWQPCSVLLLFSTPNVGGRSGWQRSGLGFPKDSFALPGMRAADLQKLKDNGTMSFHGNQHGCFTIAKASEMSC